MEIFNQINIMFLHNEKNGCLAYIEQLPQISAKGETLAEAKYNLMNQLQRYEQETYSNYTIVEYKVRSSSF